MACPVVFRCKRSGNVVSFTNENDISGMRKHEGYEEVALAVQPQPVAHTVVAKKQAAYKKQENNSNNKI